MRFSEPRRLATPARARNFCRRMGTTRSESGWTCGPEACRALFGIGARPIGRGVLRGSPFALGLGHAGLARAFVTSLAKGP